MCINDAMMLIKTATRVELWLSAIIIITHRVEQAHIHHKPLVGQPLVQQTLAHGLTAATGQHSSTPAQGVLRMKHKHQSHEGLLRRWHTVNQHVEHHPAPPNA